MALTYRNTRNGQVVTMPEPNEVIADAEVAAERASRPGTKKARREAQIIADRAAQQGVNLRQVLRKMDESAKWQRYEPSVEPAAADSAQDPKAADVRVWAQANDIEVPARGKLPTEVVDRYLAATAVSTSVGDGS